MRCLLPPDAPQHWCDIRRRTVQVANPAAGADWSVKVPVAEAWQVLWLVATLTTSAAVANRTPSLQIADEGVVVGQFKVGLAQTAGQVFVYSLVTGGPTGVTTGGAASLWGASTDVILRPGLTLLTSTNGIDVADQWSAIAFEILFELNRGEGSARRYLERRRAEEAALPLAQVAVRPAGPILYP